MKNPEVNVGQSDHSGNKCLDPNTVNEFLPGDSEQQRMALQQGEDK